MTSEVATMVYCDHCNQPVRPSLHSVEECRDNLRHDRDEAREVSAGLLSHMEVAWAAIRDMAQVIEGQRQEVTHAVKRFYPWLKQQPTVDEKAKETVD